MTVCDARPAGRKEIVSLNCHKEERVIERQLYSCKDVGRAGGTALG